jgi:hypothetical protein
MQTQLSGVPLCSVHLEKHVLRAVKVGDGPQSSSEDPGWTDGTMHLVCRCPLG